MHAYAGAAQLRELAARSVDSTIERFALRYFTLHPSPFTPHTSHFTGELAAWSLAEAAPAQDVFIP